MPRGRRPSIERTIATNLHLPETLRARLDIELFSELEGRVPHGAYQRFFSERLVEHFNSKRLDLAPFLGTEPGAAVVRGPAEIIDRLKSHLESAA